MNLSDRQAAVTRGRSGILVTISAAILILAPAIVKFVAFPAYPGSDDAFIHLAVADHIVDGHGWGIASNDSVNLSSSPIFTLILLPIVMIGSIGLAQVVSIVFACAALAVVFFGVRSTTRSPVVALASLAVAATNAHLWRWSGTVMETSLGYLAATVIAVGGLQLLTGAKPATIPRFFGFGILIGAGTLVRFEIGLFLVITIVAVTVAGIGGIARLTALIIGFITALLPWLIFATITFGTPIPTTYFAKARGLYLVNAKVAAQLGSVVVTGFGVSLVVGALALWLAVAAPEGRERLRTHIVPILFLAAWPVGMFAFYYVRSSGLESAARYYLPAMATWPLLFGLIAAAAPLSTVRARQAVTGTIVACLLAALAVTIVQIRPVLTKFNDGYRTAMEGAAAFLRENCTPGDVALIVVDIGVISQSGIGACTLADAGGLASPDLRGLELDELIAATNPTFVVQSIGGAPGEWSAQYPGLTTVKVTAYPDHGVAKAGQTDYLNIYRRTTTVE